MGTPIAPSPAAMPSSTVTELISNSSNSHSVIQAAPREEFVCDGREYCSQMTSRAEAQFFVHNCPNVKMDGDDDGLACENDSRF